MSKQAVIGIVLTAVFVFSGCGVGEPTKEDQRSNDPELEDQANVAQPEGHKDWQTSLRMTTPDDVEPWDEKHLAEFLQKDWGDQYYSSDLQAFCDGKPVPVQKGILDPGIFGGILGRDAWTITLESDREMTKDEWWQSREDLLKRIDEYHHQVREVLERQKLGVILPPQAEKIIMAIERKIQELNKELEQIQDYYVADTYRIPAVCKSLTMGFSRLQKGHTYRISAMFGTSLCERYSGASEKFTYKGNDVDLVLKMEKLPDDRCNPDGQVNVEVKF